MKRCANVNADPAKPSEHAARTQLADGLRRALLQHVHRGHHPPHRLRHLRRVALLDLPADKNIFMLGPLEIKPGIFGRQFGIVDSL